MDEGAAAIIYHDDKPFRDDFVISFQVTEICGDVIADAEVPVS